MSSPREIVPGVFVFLSEICRMASGLVLPRPGGGHPRARGALVVDPGVLPSEVDAILERLDEARAEASHVLLTHSDWDHVSGAHRFSAPVVASERFDATLEAAADCVAREIAALPGGTPPGFRSPRAASLVGSESEIVGAPRPARAFPARGHTPDGLALLLRDEGVLFAGDYLSAEEIPFVEDSFPEYLRTLARFRSWLAGPGARRVVPGHGEPLEPREALRILDEDAAYLEALREGAAGERKGSRSGAGERLAATVPPPRAAADRDVREGHRRNAERVLAEAQAAV